MKKITLTVGLILCLLCSTAHAAFKIPKYETFKLKNGLQVYLMQQSEVPLIDVRLSIKAGAVLDNKNYGLANLTGESLLLGSGKLSKTEVEDVLAFYGSELTSNTSSEMSTLQMSLATKDQNKLLPLFRDVVTKPSFDLEEFDKFKKRNVNQLKQRNESPKNIINDVFLHMYYDQHPYGNPVMGDMNSVDNLTLGDVKKFYKNYYTPDNSALIIVGDFKPKAIKKQVTKLFSSWTGKSEKTTLLSPVKDKNEANVWVLNKDDAIETTFMIGGKGIKTNHPNYVASQVLNTILGGRFTSWLNDELRVNTGLTYGARSRFDDKSSAGTFSISTFTKKETTFEALDLAIKTYKRLWQKGIDKETLNSAKAYVKGQFPPRYETSGQLANLLSRMWALNLNASIINEFEQKVNALDVEKANQLAKVLFPQDNLQIVMIGKASEIQDKAKNYGKVKVMELKTFTY